MCINASCFLPGRDISVSSFFDKKNKINNNKWVNRNNCNIHLYAVTPYAQTIILLNDYCYQQLIYYLIIIRKNDFNSRMLHLIM
jgi:hypothetical protein